MADTSVVEAAGSTALPPRILVLVAGHALLSTAPAFAFLAFVDARSLAIMWIRFSVPIAQLMLLVVWLALGAGKVRWRILVAAIATAYVAVWPVVGQMMAPGAGPAIGTLAATYLGTVGPYLLMVLLLSGACFLFRRRTGVICRCTAPPASDQRGAPWQFSLQGVLVAVSVLALVLGLARGAAHRNADSVAMRMIFSTGLSVVVFALNMLCAIWASLGLGRVEWRLVPVFVVACLTSAAVAVSSGVSTIAWWLVVARGFTFVVPTLILVALLLVVRSCGFRLVRKSDTRAASMVSGGSGATTATI